MNGHLFGICSLLQFTQINQHPASDSASHIRELLDTSRECISALQSQGINTETWDCILIQSTIFSIFLTTAFVLSNLRLLNRSRNPIVNDLNLKRSIQLLQLVESAKVQNTPCASARSSRKCSLNNDWIMSQPRNCVRIVSRSATQRVPAIVLVPASLVVNGIIRCYISLVYRNPQVPNLLQTNLRRPQTRKPAL